MGTCGCGVRLEKLRFGAIPKKVGHVLERSAKGKVDDER